MIKHIIDVSDVEQIISNIYFYEESNNYELEVYELYSDVTYSDDTQGYAIYSYDVTMNKEQLLKAIDNATIITSIASLRMYFDNENEAVEKFNQIKQSGYYYIEDKEEMLNLISDL